MKRDFIRRVALTTAALLTGCWVDGEIGRLAGEAAGDAAIADHHTDGFDAAVDRVTPHDVTVDPVKLDDTTIEHPEPGCGASFAQQGDWITLENSTWGPEEPMGGTLVIGSYRLVSYQAPISVPLDKVTVRETLVLSGAADHGTWTRLSESRGASGSFHDRAPWGEHGDFFVYDELATLECSLRCPRVSIIPYAYTAAGDTLTLVDGMEEKTYRRIP